MYFLDRATLGQKLASGLQHLRGKDAVVLCLKESSLLTCLTIAMRLRAWVYPLLMAPVYEGVSGGVPFGAFDQDGAFCLNPDLPEAERDRLAGSAVEMAAPQKQQALARIHDDTERYGLPFDKHRLDGRDIIIAGDIIDSSLPLAVAQRLLSTVSPHSVTAVAGNATPAAADQLRLCALDVTVLDVITGVRQADDRYFEQADTYTDEQKYALTHHIAAYWQ